MKLDEETAHQLNVETELNLKGVELMRPVIALFAGTIMSSLEKNLVTKELPSLNTAIESSNGDFIDLPARGPGSAGSKLLAKLRRV